MWSGSGSGVGLISTQIPSARTVLSVLVLYRMVAGAWRAFSLKPGRVTGSRWLLVWAQRLWRPSLRPHGEML